MNRILALTLILATSCGPDGDTCAKVKNEKECMEKGCDGFHGASYFSSNADGSCGPMTSSGSLCIESVEKESVQFSISAGYFRDYGASREFVILSTDRGEIDGWSRCEDLDLPFNSCGCSQ